MRSINRATLLALLSLSAMAADAETYLPLIMWSDKGIAKNSVEDAQDITGANAITKMDDLIQSFDPAEPSYLFVVMKDGLHSLDIVEHSKDLSFLSKRVEKHAMMFPHMTDAIDEQEFTQHYNSPYVYDSASLPDIDSLKKVLLEDLASDITQVGNTKVFLIKASSHASMEKFDNFLKGINKNLHKLGPSVVVVTGNNEISPADAFISLAQTSSTQTVGASNKCHDLYCYVTPIILNGLLISVFMFFFVIFAVMQIFNI